MQSHPNIERRQFIFTATAATAGVIGTHWIDRTADGKQKGEETNDLARRYRVSACDWMMLKRHTPGAIARAKECSCDGVEVDLGSLSKNPTFENKFLNEPGFAEKYLQTCKEQGIEISSVAMSAFYAQPFPEREIDRPLRDCIATMKLLGVKVAFLPLGVYGDLVARPEVRPAVVERLQRVGRWAEEAGVVIGIETSLDAEGDRKLLKDIGSQGIKIYFNFQNGVRHGRNLLAELKTLGKEHIVQIHASNDDVYWLKDDPAIPMFDVKKTLDEMDWSGWLVIERSRHKDHGRDVLLNFSTNVAYLKKVFQ